ncbi:hypothetical protein VTK73DRAFT_120 [Phialemonium thermophilum]|uniref:Uncharacterized protein n=1 Tax=Phialemonium thermophilum TaxID=223376 RepID=A0ABR3Y414_9PEZI
MVLVDEPLFTPPERDAVDMKLLWFYTTKTFRSFQSDHDDPTADEVLRVKVVQHAFEAPFLMNTLLGLAGLHLRALNQDVPTSRILEYRATSFYGYRKAIEEARTSTYPALLACSLLLCGLSSEHFRDDDAKPLYILDWINIWKGIGLIVRLIKPKALIESGMQTLFYRPPVDLEASASHIPNNLLFMVTSIAEDDDDFEHTAVYYETLKYLGSLYKELKNGLSNTLALRIITFFTFLPQQFIQLAQARRPRALVIIAYYLVFAKMCHDLWWMDGISDREIAHICNLLGDKWSDLLRIPRAAVSLIGLHSLASLLLDDHAWMPMLDEGDRDTEKPHLVDNEGNGLLIVGDLVYRMPQSVRKQKTHGFIEIAEDFREEQDKTTTTSSSSNKDYSPG